MLSEAFSPCFTTPSSIPSFPDFLIRPLVAFSSLLFVSSIKPSNLSRPTIFCCGIWLNVSSNKKGMFGGKGRGSMKVAYWSNRESIYSTQVQEKIFKDIGRGISKDDFSSLDVYQYVDADKRQAYSEKLGKKYEFDITSLVSLFDSAKKKHCVCRKCCKD